MDKQKKMSSSKLEDSLIDGEVLNDADRTHEKGNAFKRRSHNATNG